MTHGAVIDLTDKKIRTVIRQIHHATNLSGWLQGVFASVLSRLFVFGLNHLSNRLTDDAIWFKWVSQKLWDDNVDVREQSERLYCEIERIKTSTLFIHNLAIHQAEKATRPALINMHRQLASSTAELFESLEGFRWTLKELEANYSATHQQLYTNNKDELMQLLHEAKVADNA